MSAVYNKTDVSNELNTDKTVQQPQQKSCWLGRQFVALGNKCNDVCPKIEAAVCHAFRKVDQFFTRLLDPNTPNNIVQDKLDAVGNYIEKTFAPLEKFNTWLNDNGQGAWYKQLATFLVKLPMRAVRNIVQTLYSLIKGLVYFCVHPVKAMHKFVDTLGKLMDALGKPETWTKIGAGMIGAGLGQAAIPGNPLFVISVLLGAVCLFGGLTVSAIDAALDAKKGSKMNAAWQTIVEQAKALPEALLTGFCSGVIVAAIQYPANVRAATVANNRLARSYADGYVRVNRFPQYSNLTVRPNGAVVLDWQARSRFGYVLPSRVITTIRNYTPVATANPVWGALSGGAVAASRA